ncbi:hypothetical protein BDR06DRAFT_1011159 [Suillus hirtellus]|nr:hypothetical protein BDR06DRAFT_1011159 [Suillus hirtellus]
MSALTSSPTPFLPSWTMQQKLDATVEMNQCLLEENRALAGKLDAAEAHCMLALEQMDNLQKKLHSSKMRRKEGTINVGARGLTSAAGLRAWEAEKAVRAEKARKKAEAVEQQEAQEVAVQAAHNARGPTTAFSSSLNSKLKADLLELAQALSISLDGARNNAECIAVIQAHLDGHPQLKDDMKFAGLYGWAPHGQKRMHMHTSATDENVALASATVKQPEHPAVRR